MYFAYILLGSFGLINLLQFNFVWLIKSQRKKNGKFGWVNWVWQLLRSYQLTNFAPSKFDLKWLRYGQKYCSQPLHFWETRWWLARYKLRLCKLNKPTLLFAQSKSDLKWLRYDQNRNIIASHGISGRLAGGQLVSKLIQFG